MQIAPPDDLCRDCGSPTHRCWCDTPDTPPQSAAWQYGTPDEATATVAETLREVVGRKLGGSVDLGVLAANIVYDLVLEGAVTLTIPDAPVFRDHG